MPRAGPLIRSRTPGVAESSRLQERRRLGDKAYFRQRAPEGIDERTLRPISGVLADGVIAHANRQPTNETHVVGRCSPHLSALHPARWDAYSPLDDRLSSHGTHRGWIAPDRLCRRARDRRPDARRRCTCGYRRMVHAHVGSPCGSRHRNRAAWHLHRRVRRRPPTREADRSMACRPHRQWCRLVGSGRPSRRSGCLTIARAARSDAVRSRRPTARLGGPFRESATL